MGQMAEVVLPLALAFIMMSLGLGLTGADFRRVVVQPRDFLIGAASQIALLPLVAFALVSVWPLAPELAVGVMLIAAAPGGVTSNLLTRFAGGDTALSVSLTGTISLVSIVTRAGDRVFFALDRFRRRAGNRPLDRRDGAVDGRDRRGAGGDRNGDPDGRPGSRGAGRRAGPHRLRGVSSSWCCWARSWKTATTSPPISPRRAR